MSDQDHSGTRIQGHGLCKQVDLRTPQDVFNVEIPDRFQSVPIEWAEKWKKVPSLRRSVCDLTGKVYTSPKLASQYNQMSAWNRRLGRSFGMKETFELRMLRRGAVAALPSKSPPSRIRKPGALLTRC